MDTISDLTAHSELETLPISTPTLFHSLKSNITTQQQPDITNTPTCDIPPPHFMSSIDELRSFSSVLSAFISRYDELQNHVNFINSSIDSKLPRHLVDTANPNQPALTRFLETSCDQIITALPEVVVSEQNPRESASDCERSHAIARTPESPNFSHNSEETGTSKNPDEIDVFKKHVEDDTSKKREEIDVSKKLEEFDVSKYIEEIDTLKKPEETVLDPEEIVSEQNPNCREHEQSHEDVRTPESLEEVDALKKLELIDVSMNPEEIDTLKKTELETCHDQAITGVAEDIVSEQNPNGMTANCEQIREDVRTPESPEEIDTLMKTEETVPETSCDQTITAVPEAIVLDQNSNGLATNCKRIHEDVRMPESLEEIDVSKEPEEIDTLMKTEETVSEQNSTGMATNCEQRSEDTRIPESLEEIGVSKKTEEIDTLMNTEETVSKQNPNGMATNCEQSGEDTRTPGSLEEIDVWKKPEEIDNLKIPEETDSSMKHEETGFLKKGKEINGSMKPDKNLKTSKMSSISVLEYLCQDMNSRMIKRHIAKHFSEMNNLRHEIAKALKVAKDPANLVVISIGKFFVSGSKIFYKGSDQTKQHLGRMAAVLILECFVMISSDGIKIAKRDQEYAAKAAFDWRNRMIREGGLGHTDEVDARGLLLLISGFGIQDHVFTIQDIMDLIMASNVKGISTALRHSVFLIPKIPEVINLMVMNNLEIEAVDIAYTFGLKDTHHPRSILTTYLHKKVKDIQNDSSFEMLEAMKQQLFDLKSVKQCLESHNVDPSMLLPDFKIKEKILNLTSRIENKPEVIDTLMETKETVLETSCDQDVTVVLEAIVSEQNPNGMATTCEQINENVRTPESLEEIDVLKKPEEIDVLKKPEEIEILKKPEEIDTLMKTEETVPETSCDQTITAVLEAIVLDQNPDGLDANCEQSSENVRTPESLEEIDVSKKPGEIDILKKPEQTDFCMNSAEIDTSKKHEENGILKKAKETNGSMKPEENSKTSKKCIISVLELLCQAMNSKGVRKHVATHYGKMSKLRKEFAKALKLAKDPAKLVLDSIGRFFVQGSRSFCKDSDQTSQHLGRMAAVLILECFVMISSDGIKIAKRDQEHAAEAAFDWRKRMIREGGLAHTDEVDARGLLLLISGFGIQDHVFKIQDIADLIIASKLKGISAALCRSIFLIPKIPEVVYLMVMNNLEIEAVDIAYTFELEDTCHARDILTTYLRKKIKDIKYGSSFQKLEAMKQQLLDLKSVKQCLKSHNIDPSTLLPDFKINEKMQNLEKEIHEGQRIQKRKSLENPIHHEAKHQKRKSLENPIHHEAKRACFSHENMPRQQKRVDHHDMSPYKRSTQPSTSKVDFDRNLGNSYIPYYSASSVYNAPATPKHIPGLVPNGAGGGFPGSYDQMRHPANVRPYGLHEPYGQHYLRHGQTYDSPPYGQHYSRHGQTYDSPPYGRPLGRGPPPDSLQSGGFQGRRGPSLDLYSFADLVEKESRGFRSSGSNGA
ncbi:hypothetical protein L1987_79998 [Smallanthus sonchifolius]|uniref:Uncharacterized protein n=1 Tax=Smallanthus sonchifolius TaxID=185202 RepID=A0ACB8YKQ5_9ASTR|nr:hypothetical protein L1987_79998 [Smallanthus sonchifolius]